MKNEIMTEKMAEMISHLNIALKRVPWEKIVKFTIAFGAYDNNGKNYGASSTLFGGNLSIHNKG